MNKKEDSSKSVNSEPNISKNRKTFLNNQEKKLSVVTNLFNISNNSIINNTNNDIIDDDDIDEENIFEKTIGEQILQTPINETHRLFINRNKFGKTFINSIPLKRILIPKTKLPNKKSNENLKRNEINNVSLKNDLNEKNEIFSLHKDFLHCRNCMLIVAVARYGKYSFNK